MADKNTKDGIGSTDVAFLYKTMIQRDPSKRKVKPVEKHLMQIHFGMSDDDESDSDYEFNPEAGSDGEDFDFDEPRDEDMDEKDKNEAETVTSTDSEFSSESVEEDEETAKARQALERELSSLRVCSVCVNSFNRDDDEIIECDGCGILVHEGCYGVEDDNISISNESGDEELSEIWFCDSCKAGVKPTCELCPNTFGIYKQTDTGRWVHLICALYVPGVAFGNTQKLSNITLLEMAYSKWGHKECSLCEDENYSNTGVCIGCDAGMCKTFFHVSCAQRMGLLSEAAEEDIADPFYAHCKMHGDKLVSKQKKRNFLALHSHFKQFQEERENKPLPRRIQNRLSRYLQKHNEIEAKRPPAWVPPSKLPRALCSSATAVRNLTRKAELLGLSPIPRAVTHFSEVSKKSYVAPALSVEFASYFHERNHKVDSLKRHNKELLKSSKRLRAQESELRTLHDSLKATLVELGKNHEENRHGGLILWKALQAISEKPVTIPRMVVETPKSSVSQGKSTSRNNVTQVCGICSSSRDQHQLAKCDQCNKHYHLGCLDPPLTRMPKKSKLCGWVCSICDHNSAKAQDGPSVQSDVDMEAPRKLRQTIKEPIKFAPPEMHLYIEREREAHSDFTQSHKPLRKRMKIKRDRKPLMNKKSLPPPLKMDTSVPEEKDVDTDDLPDKKVKVVLSDSSGDIEAAKAISADSAITPLDSTSLSNASNHKAGRRSKVLETGTCLPCNNFCNGSDAVVCDMCKEWFHFGCLTPPQKKTPKHKGYSWNCADCEKKVEYKVVNKVCADIPKAPILDD